MQIHTHKHSLKSQGSCKLDAYCTAGIVITQNEHGIIAHICSTHYGHSLRLGHLRLPKLDRCEIAAKLYQGVTFERILVDIRDNTESGLKTSSNS